MNLDHFVARYSGAGVKIVNVLSHEQKFSRLLRQFRDRFVRGIWFRVTDSLPPFAIPFPN